MKLLWLDLNSSYAHSSLALPAIHAQMMEQDTIKWDVLSATINENISLIVDRICQYQPDVIAATCWLFNHEVLLHILARVDALCPQCTLLLGGPEFLGNNESFLRTHRFIDFVFRGEGEESAPHFFRLLSENTQTDFEHEEIPGLCFLTSDHRYIDKGLARVADFQALVAPDQSPFFNWSKPFVQLETTRGCFNTCAFCVSGGEKPVRTISIETVHERLETIHQHSIKNVRVLDRTFNYSPKRAKEMLTLFKNYTPDICFHLEIHPALLSPELKAHLQTLPDGLLHLEAGIQSLREPVLEACKRQGKLADALEGLKFLCSLPNMETHVDLIAGLPLYHLSEMIEDISILAEFNAGEIQLESLKLLPGTDMRRRAEKLGISYSPFPPYEVLKTNEISTEELIVAQRLSRLLDGYYNAPVWRQLTRQLILQIPHFLSDFLDYLTQKDVIDQPLSLEKRGLLLYEFCGSTYPAYLPLISIAWIEAGMSLKKKPAERVRTKREQPSDSWKVLYGAYKADLRLCFLPVDQENGGYWFGFESDTQRLEPVFKATNLNITA